MRASHNIRGSAHLLNPQMLGAAKRAAGLQTQGTHHGPGDPAATGAPGASRERTWVVRVMLSNGPVEVRLSTAVTKPHLRVIPTFGQVPFNICGCWDAGINLPSS